jgi:protein O-mannosyl-transferase
MSATNYEQATAKTKKRTQTPTKTEAPIAIENPIKYTWGIVIAVIAFALFANTIGHDYVLDDSGAINENRYVLEGISGIPKLMKVEFWHFANIHLGYYRPLSLITFALENEFVQNNPHVSHFFNVLIFALSGFVLFIVLSKIFKTTHSLFPFFITLLFMAHPLHTEIVANIKGRDELLSFLNTLLMLSFSLRYIDTKKILHLVLSLVFCYLGMLSKETALVGVVLLPVVMYYYTTMTIKECLQKSVWVLGIIGLFFIQKNYLLDTPTIIPSDIVNYPYTDNAIKWPTTFMLFAFSVRLLLLPHPLRYDYSFNQIPAVDFSSAGALVGLILFVLGIYFGYKLALKKSVFGFALALFYISLVPALAFTILRGGIFAERFLFLPTLGFCVALVYGFVLLFKIDIAEISTDVKTWLQKQAKFSLLISCVILLYSFKTVSRNAVWKDNLTLFGTDVKTGKNSAQNQRHLGNEYIRLALSEKDNTQKITLAQKGIAANREALRIHPKFGEGYYLIGMAYQTLIPNNDSAIYYYNMAIKYAPGYAIPYYNLGVLYQGLGKNNVASYYYNQAMLYNPEYLEPKQAAENLRKIGIDVHINPLQTKVDFNTADKNSTYYFDLGNYYASNSDYENAVKSYLQSIEMSPGNENVYINLANCYGMLKQYDKGIEVANQILQKNPNSLLALKNLSVTYSLLGNTEKAKEYMERLQALEKQQ